MDGVRKVYKNFEKVCVFQPHRISRLKDLRKEFTYAFKNADKVILCPIFTAGEKIKLGFSYTTFAREIINNSKVELFIVMITLNWQNFLKICLEKIVIGMGGHHF